eukprot:GILJ01015004.1.p1 GENE.GILJ01015004.1~~GILJ01015004.1.p1  ORF type:complete len:216 (-),score=16.51 GILJ01015004.1:37-684(-)
MDSAVKIEQAASRLTKLRDEQNAEIRRLMMTPLPTPSPVPIPPTPLPIPPASTDPTSTTLSSPPPTVVPVSVPGAGGTVIHLHIAAPTYTFPLPTIPPPMIPTPTPSPPGPPTTPSYYTTSTSSRRRSPVRVIQRGINGGLFYINQAGNTVYLTPKQRLDCRNGKLTNAVNCPLVAGDVETRTTTTIEKKGKRGGKDYDLVKCHRHKTSGKLYCP